ncbi:MAG: alpha-maltose-phosphate synthase [Frankiaceae bacterium]|nr:alpha-maltose-phosphate synthase [Frankiaceae bacterium]
MRVGLLTKEYPPEVYGGAGVHVEYLARELTKLVEVHVHCMGADREGATAHRPPVELADANAALATIGTDLLMADAVAGLDLVHSHTWYANLAGHVASLLHGMPHVMTTHSLEPHRPWKAEQLGGGYALSSWVERVAVESAAAVIAVSEGMRGDVLAAYPAVDPGRVHVVHNGIDTSEYAPVDAEELERVRSSYSLADPYVLFVGRITRQKGLPHLIAAARDIDPAAQLVLCAAAPDTPEIEAEVRAGLAELEAARGNVRWISSAVPRRDLVALLSGAAVFVCPSVYEPLGIVNLEAMACATPVVASRVGGIPEVVVDGATGLLVEPADEPGLAAAVNELLANPDKATAMGAAGRERAVSEFSWTRIAEQTVELYRDLL